MPHEAKTPAEETAKPGTNNTKPATSEERFQPSWYADSQAFKAATVRWKDDLNQLTAEPITAEKTVKSASEPSPEPSQELTAEYAEEATSEPAVNYAEDYDQTYETLK